MTTPKARFLANEAAARWVRDVVDHTYFLEALQAAQLTFNAKLADSNLGAVEGYNQMQGAQKFITELVKIANVPSKTPHKPASDNLDPRA